MREATFDFEKLLFYKPADAPPDNHVFIAGLARSGSTVLLNAIASSGDFASLTYEDMPFVLAPNFWRRLNPARTHAEAAERAHGDGVIVSTNSPEAFEEVFWKTFGEAGSEDEFRTFVALITRRHGHQRYLSKNNQNVRRLGLIGKIFPHSHILVPFRQPAHHAHSLYVQHLKFQDLQRTDAFVRDYMTWIGHSEFGADYRPIIGTGLRFPDPGKPDHWLEQWLRTYASLRDVMSGSPQIVPVCYEAICTTPDAWPALKARLGLAEREITPFILKNQNRPVADAFDAALLQECDALYADLAKLAASPAPLCPPRGR